MIIHKSITVARPTDVAFKIFTEEWDKWWPKNDYSFLGPEADTIIEPKSGGRFYEKAPDGREYTIGEVIAYEPGAHLAFTWNHENNAGTTEVDVRFIAEGNGTRIELTHGGFEKLTDDKMAAGYNAGWDQVLAAYVNHATQ